MFVTGCPKISYTSLTTIDPRNKTLCLAPDIYLAGILCFLHRIFIYILCLIKSPLIFIFASLLSYFASRFAIYLCLLPLILYIRDMAWIVRAAYFSDADRQWDCFTLCTLILDKIYNHITRFQQKTS